MRKTFILTALLLISVSAATAQTGDIQAEAIQPQVDAGSEFSEVVLRVNVSGFEDSSQVRFFVNDSLKAVMIGRGTVNLSLSLRSNQTYEWYAEASNGDTSNRTGEKILRIGEDEDVALPPGLEKEEVQQRMKSQSVFEQVTDAITNLGESVFGDRGREGKPRPRKPEKISANSPEKGRPGPNVPRGVNISEERNTASGKKEENISANKPQKTDPSLNRTRNQKHPELNEIGETPKKTVNRPEKTEENTTEDSLDRTDKSGTEDKTKTGEKSLTENTSTTQDSKVDSKKTKVKEDSNISTESTENTTKTRENTTKDRSGPNTPSKR